MKLRQQLHAAASRILLSKEDVDDALQELFIKVWQNAETDAHPAQKQAFLYKTLRNICIDTLRKRKLSAEASEYIRLTATESEMILDRIDNQDKLTNLHLDAKRLLNGLQLKVFELYTTRELEYTEIAELLNISPEMARSYMCRARKTLREQCNKLLNDN